MPAESSAGAAKGNQRAHDQGVSVGGVFRGTVPGNIGLDDNNIPFIDKTLHPSHLFNGSYGILIGVASLRDHQVKIPFNTPAGTSFRYILFRKGPLEKFIFRNC